MLQLKWKQTYENCTGGDKSFGFVESAPASGNVAPKTVFAGTAKNCNSAGLALSLPSFDAWCATPKFKAGSSGLKNCTAKNNKSFATHSDPRRYLLV